MSDDTPEIKVTVVPPTVPTTAAAFHDAATHVDALGMPVAFTPPLIIDGRVIEGTGGDTYHPTPCCGAAASVNDGPMYCKGCYHEVDDAFGNVPLEPFHKR